MKTVLIFFASCFVFSVFAQTPKIVTLQNGLNAYAGCNDISITTIGQTMIHYNKEGNNFKSKAITLAYYECCGKTTIRGCIRYDLSHIPKTAKIVKATLSLYRFDQYTLVDEEPLSWKISALTTELPTDTCSWFVPWKKAGGDFSQTPIDSIYIEKSVNGWETYTITSAIQEILSGKQKNNGFIVSFSSTGESLRKVAYHYHSSESDSVALRPKLELTIVNEPTPILTAIPFKQNDICIYENKIFFPNPGISLLTGYSMNGKKLFVETLNHTNAQSWHSIPTDKEMSNKPMVLSITTGNSVYSKVVLLK